jgi:hypothetical protein
MKPPYSIQELCEKGSYVLHRETGTVFRAKCLYEAGEYISPSNGKPVDAVVLEAHEGHSFVVKEDVFVPLTDLEVEIYASYVQLITSTTMICGNQASARKIPIEVFGVLASSALREQQRQLDLVVRHHEGLLVRAAAQKESS